MQVTTFWGIMITLLAAQTALFYWKKRHKRSYELVGWPGHIQEQLDVCMDCHCSIRACATLRLVLPPMAAPAPTE